MRGVFVTATDTGVGKTIVCAAMLAAMAAEGERGRAYKPVITGLRDPEEIAARGRWPPDHELLARVAGMDAEQVAPLRYGPAASPHLAAQLAGAPIDPSQMLAHARTLAGDGDDDDKWTLVVEGVGGLLVPLTGAYCVRDLAADLRLPVVVAARPGLGTINHTLLTLAGARAAGLDVRAVVLTPWPAEPSDLQLSNRETIASLGQVAVHVLANVHGPGRDELARAGTALPWRGWVDLSPPA